ncbi:uncharacterized protein LOC117337872 [Pecten maximus]|uniref:uncharacterized protein LOC117337872 n=1 Tax=Pecten maximus TaxID=6579 RepID=UPI001458E82B|nr:uncharacterized protein LOC117337872 [Pecten maximus]
MQRKIMLFLFLVIVGMWSQMASGEEMSNPVIGMSPTTANLANQFIKLKHDIRYKESLRLKAKLELNQRVTELERERASDMNEFNKRITDLKRLREADGDVIRNLTNALRSLRSENTVLKAKLDKGLITTEVARGLPTTFANFRSGSSEATVAFHTILTDPLINPGVHQTIIFDKVVTKVGAQISNNTGVFTCDQSGVYVFSWQILLEGSNYIISELAKNGQSVGSQEIGNTIYTISGSSTAVVTLAYGDEVWVRVVALSPGSDVLPNLTMFAGFRLP